MLQRLLPLWSNDATLDRFYPGGNSVLLNLLRDAVDKAMVEANMVLTWGPAGCGKSHVLQAMAQHASALEQRVAYLPCNEVDVVAMAQGLEAYTVVCWDDVQTLLGDPEREEAWMAAFQAWQDTQRGLWLVSASVTPQQLMCVLPDVHSRLCGALVLPCHPLEDAELKVALKWQAERVGLALPDRTLHYVFQRCRRDQAHLFRLFATLQETSLAQRKPLSIPWIKDLVAQGVVTF